MQEEQESLKGTVHLKDGSIVRVDIDNLAKFLETHKDTIVVRKIKRREPVRRRERLLDLAVLELEYKQGEKSDTEIDLF